VRTTPENVHLATPGAPHQLDTPVSGNSAGVSVTASEHGSAISDFQALPWWPAATQEGVLAQPFYHASTQLPSGQLSMIIDPGAWTWAPTLAQRAIAAGQTPAQTRLERPLAIQGVGNGSQKCEWQITCPIAVPHTDGASHQHKVTAPIVEGSGEELPGLLGLRSLEHERAILDCGNRMLHFVGPGGAQITLPPGSISIPLQKAPSGHLVMIIDAYEHVQGVQGGLPEASLQLHSTTATSTSSASTIHAH